MGGCAHADSVLPSSALVTRISVRMVDAVVSFIDTTSAGGGECPHGPPPRTSPARCLSDDVVADAVRALHVLIGLGGFFMAGRG